MAVISRGRTAKYYLRPEDLPALNAEVREFARVEFYNRFRLEWSERLADELGLRPRRPTFEERWQQVRSHLTHAHEMTEALIRDEGWDLSSEPDSSEGGPHDFRNSLPLWAYHFFEPIQHGAQVLTMSLAVEDDLPRVHLITKLLRGSRAGKPVLQTTATRGRRYGDGETKYSARDFAVVGLLLGTRGDLHDLDLNAAPSPHGYRRNDILSKEDRAMRSNAERIVGTLNNEITG